MGVEKGFLCPFCRKWEYKGGVISERDSFLSNGVRLILALKRSE